MVYYMTSVTTDGCINGSGGGGAKEFAIYTQPYFDRSNNCYKNIITISDQPKGELQKYVVRVTNYKPSPFYTRSDANDACILALYTMRCGYQGSGDLMDVTEITDLMLFFERNLYRINTDITRIVHESNGGPVIRDGKKLVCFVSKI